MTSSPGTVSKIVWHFTGGPKWDQKKDKISQSLKPENEAYKALVEILTSMELRLSHYREIVKRIQRFSGNSSIISQIETSKVCCVAEIPIQHLSYHRNRYGKFAIGFYRSSVLKAGFRPVLYSLEDDWVIHEIEKAWWRVQTSRPQTTFQTPLFEDHPDDTAQHREEKKKFKSWFSAIQKFERFLAYVKTFDKTEFDSIYSEREWRNIKSFTFKEDDVFMIISPKTYVTKIKSVIPNIISKIPIVAYEDLIEH